MYELTLILSILILGYVLNIIQKDETLLVIPSNENIHDTLFKCISISSLFIIVYLIICKGFKSGIIEFLFTWGFLVILTPIPEASIILTVPLKYFTKIPLEHGLIPVSLFAISLLLLIYKKYFGMMKKTSISGLFAYILEKRMYHMVILSIASSIMISKFVNDAIDAHTQKDSIFFVNDTNKHLAILTVISLLAYFQTIRAYNIEISY